MPLNSKKCRAACSNVIITSYVASDGLRDIVLSPVGKLVQNSTIGSWTSANIMSATLRKQAATLYLAALPDNRVLFSFHKVFSRSSLLIC